MVGYWNWVITTVHLKCVFPQIKWTFCTSLCNKIRLDFWDVMYLFQKIYYSCGIVIILSLCFPSRIPKQLVFYYLPCSFYWERPCFKWSVTLDMYIIGEIKTGILFKDFYICTTYRKRQKIELISYCFFCSTCRLSSNSGQKNIYTFCIQSCLLRPTLSCEKKKKDYLFLRGYQKKNFCGKKNALLKHFFKDFLAQNGFQQDWL